MPAPLQCYAVCAPGLETILAAELAGLHLTPGELLPGGVEFAAHHSGIYRANLELRTAGRVLVRAASFHAHSFFELERHAARIPWEHFVPPGATVAFRVTSRKSKLYHEDAVAERLGRAVTERIAGAVIGEQGAGSGERDDIEENPLPAPRLPLTPQLFVARLWRDELTLSADSSGGLLHRRGWRLATAKAPLRETLAAAMLAAAGYDGTAPLVDPFCGAGTLPIEAALLARRMAPGRRRPFAFERWPSFEGATWSRVKHEAEAKVLPAAPAPIVGTDRDAGAIEAAQANAERAGVAADVRFERAAVSELDPPPARDGTPRGWVVTNPPWGVRVGNRAALRDLYAAFGRVLRERAGGWRAAMLSADRRLESATGIRWEEGFSTSAGGTDVRLALTDLPG
jgi:putative N6-adenine-specific DNA methylase